MVGDEILDLEAPGVVIDTVKAQPDDPAVNYRYARDPARSCGLCEHFQAPGKCELVAGVIRSVDSCNFWEGRPDGGKVRAEVMGDQGEAEDVAVPQSRDLPIDEPQVKLDAVQAVLIPQEHPRVQGYVPDAPPQVQAELVGKGEFGDPQGAPRVRAELSEDGTSDGAKKGWDTRRGGAVSKADAGWASEHQKNPNGSTTRVDSMKGSKSHYSIGPMRGQDPNAPYFSRIGHTPRPSGAMDIDVHGPFKDYDAARAAADRLRSDEERGTQKSAKDLGVVAALRPH